MGITLRLSIGSILANELSKKKSTNLRRAAAIDFIKPFWPRFPVQNDGTNMEKTMAADTSREELLRLTGEIVAAHLRHNSVAAEGVPGVIRAVYTALASASAPPQSDAGREPAVPVKRSVFPDYIVCLEDGKKLTTLKRYLRATFGMTPEQYRNRWGLPADYPMTAPNYARRRSDLAKRFGLGRPRAAPEVSVRWIGEGVSARKAARL